MPKSADFLLSEKIYTGGHMYFNQGPLGLNYNAVILQNSCYSTHQYINCSFLTWHKRLNKCIPK